MSLFQAPATVHSVRTLVDGSMKIDLVTQELPADEMTKLFQLKGTLGWFLMSPNTLQEKDIPKTNAPMKEGKTPMQRLTGVIFVEWSTLTDKSLDFDTFLRQRIEKYINEVKDRLPEK